jgi:tryptophan synthase beta chain
VQAWPDARGRFGEFGGRFVAETLMPALLELEAAYAEARKDEAFQRAFEAALGEVVGRPSLLTHAKRLRPGIYLKREDLNHTGSHKINNTVGQALLCQRMGKRRVIAETGAGMHGVATATACALMGLPCVVYMGARDVERQALNVARMRVLGAEVRSVATGSQTLKDAMNEAMRDWVTNVESTYYLVGSAAGPHPYPALVRDLQAVIGREARQQCLHKFDALPDYAVACVGGGSNAIGLFTAFLDDPVRLVGCEAAGCGLASGQHSASLTAGTVGVLHGARTKILQTDDGQICSAHSIAAGLDYPGVGPEHCQLQATGRATYRAIDDQEALAALRALALREGILCALESAHAVAGALQIADAEPGARILVCLSGRGDKDVPQL